MGIDLRAELPAMRVVHGNDAQRGPIQDHLALILAHHREAVLCREYGPLVAHQVSERFSHRWIRAAVRGNALISACADPRKLELS